MEKIQEIIKVLENMKQYEYSCMQVYATGTKANIDALAQAITILRKIEDTDGIREVIDQIYDVDDGIPLWDNVARAIQAWLKGGK